MKSGHNYSAESRIASIITFGVLLMIILGTVQGLWLKWFWLGFVFASGC